MGPVHHDVAIYSDSVHTETEMSSFWWNFHHWLHWKLSKWQLPVQPVIKISSKWRHFRFSVSCFRLIEGEDTENPFICHIMKLLWLLRGKGARVRFYMSTKPLWHWGKWKSGPTSKRDHWPRHRPTDKCPLYTFESTGNPAGNPHIQQLVQTKWDAAVHAQRSHDLIITSLLRQNDVATSFWRNNDVIFTSCVRWVAEISISWNQHWGHRRNSST